MNGYQLKRGRDRNYKVIRPANIISYIRIQQLNSYNEMDLTSFLSETKMTNHTAVYEIRFFTHKEIHDLAEGFEILWIRGGYEETVGLYLVCSERMSDIFLLPERGPSNLPPFETLQYALSSAFFS